MVGGHCCCGIHEYGMVWSGDVGGDFRRCFIRLMLVWCSQAMVGSMCNLDTCRRSHAKWLFFSFEFHISHSAGSHQTKIRKLLGTSHISQSTSKLGSRRTVTQLLSWGNMPFRQEISWSVWLSNKSLPRCTDSSCTNFVDCLSSRIYIDVWFPRIQCIWRIVLSRAIVQSYCVDSE